MNTIERRIRFAAMIMFVALFLEFIGLAWRHPLAFAIVHMTALGLFAVACAVYLLSLLPTRD